MRRRAPRSGLLPRARSPRRASRAVAARMSARPPSPNTGTTCIRRPRCSSRCPRPPRCTRQHPRHPHVCLVPVAPHRARATPRRWAPARHHISTAWRSVYKFGSRASNVWAARWFCQVCCRSCCSGCCLRAWCLWQRRRLALQLPLPPTLACARPAHHNHPPLANISLCLCTTQHGVGHVHSCASLIGWSYASLV